jgi:hypothetical protein
MGMTYEELGVYGRLRKVARCGPVSMFRAALQLWRGRYSAAQVADMVRGVLEGRGQGGFADLCGQGAGQSLDCMAAVADIW